MVETKNTTAHSLYCSSPVVIKRQRLVFGVLLLIAFFGGWTWLVFVVCVLMFIAAAVPPQYSPLYRLCSLGTEQPVLNGCGCRHQETSFACILGGFVLGITIVFFYHGYVRLAWGLVVFVGSLSLLAATTGFCLGNLVFAWLKRRFSRHVP